MKGEGPGREITDSFLSRKPIWNRSVNEQIEHES
jgi:hypothetical protein